jgi:hypothetical protein
MLTVYTNQNEILKSTGTTQGSRLETVDKELLDVRNFSVTFAKGAQPNLEMHVYTPDGVYLTGNHKTLYSIENNDTTSQKVAYQHISIDNVKELDVLGIVRGQYKIVYNLFDNLLGSYEGQKAFIKEISPSRRELRIQLSQNSPELLRQLSSFKSRWETLSRDDIFDSFVINFGFNDTYQIINLRFDTDTDIPEIVAKLYEPLPSRFGEKSKIWISEEILVPIVESVSIVPKFIGDPVTNIAGPNFELEGTDGGSIATDFKSWNDLLSENMSTSQQLIDSYFSGSLSGIKLNINYRDFSNFIHYGSAVERVKNFKYKLELIEYFSSQLDSLKAIENTDVIDVNIQDTYNKRNKVVSGFDDFEKYLFFENTGSALYSHVDNTSGSINPWPKKGISSTTYTWAAAYEFWDQAYTKWNAYASYDPYSYFADQVEINSVQGSTYYYDLLEQAEIYDKFNVHALTNTVPMQIQNSSDGEDYALFVNMISQHFDILWTYINNLTSIKYREEHPKDGMPDDLLYHVAESMGFSLLNGKSTSELWKYSLGTNADGTINSDSIPLVTTLSDESNTKEVWRRIVNNLPYILKTKGTSRAIKALMTCFGIPQSILTIKEYGGPSTFTDADHFPEYVHDVYHKAWLANGLTELTFPPTTYLDNGTGTLVPPNTLEFRFKTDNNFTYNYGSIYRLCHTPEIDIYLGRQNNYNNLGKIIFTDSNSNIIEVDNLEIFDNSWHLITIDQTNSSTTVKVTKSLYGKKIYINSGSCGDGDSMFSNSSEIIFSPIAFNDAFKGHIHEIRLWSGSLDDNTLIEHAQSPASYTFNVNRNITTTGDEAAAPFRHLLQRYPLSDSNFTNGNYFYSAHPNQTTNISGSINQAYLYVSSPSNFVLEGFEETYYTPSPSLGGSSLYTNKVRIESSSLDANKRLNTKTRIEKSSFDRYSLDSNRVGVYFSPQTAINEDIFNQLGYFEIDDYIGDPGDTYSESYNELTNFAKNYWLKYENRNDFEAYFRALEIYDFTLFKYIKKMLPQRSNAVVGLVVEPNVLERSRVRLNRKPTIEDLTHETVIAQFDLPMDMDYEDLEGAVEEMIAPPAVDFDDDRQAILDGVIINPDIDYDNIDIGELSGIAINPNLDYDDTGIGELSGITLEPFIDYDAEKNALLVNNLPVFTDSAIIKSKDGLIEKEDHEPVLTDSTIIKSKDSIIAVKPLTAGTISNIPKSTVLTKIDTINKTGNAWVQNRYIGQYKLTQSSSYIPVQKFVFESRQSNALQKINYFYSSAASASAQLPYSSSYSFADVHRETSAGWRNARYVGCKLSATAINVNSAQTVDGGPVVKVTKVNPNKIIFANGQLTTIDEATTGIKKKSI